MKMRKFLFYIAVAILIPINNYSQEADLWTLERCIEYALENNLSIQRMELQSRISSRDLNQSKYNMLPSLGAGVEHQLSSGRSLNTEIYEWENKKKQQGSAGLRSDLTLFNGFQNLNNISFNKFLYLSSQEDLEAIKNDMTLSVVAYYLDILFAEELLEVARSQYEVTLLQVDKNRKLVEVGNAAKSELLEIQAQASSEKLRVTMAENSLQLAVLDLTQLLDLDSVGNFTVYKPEDLVVDGVSLSKDMQDIYSTAVEFLPQIKSAEYMVRAQEKAVDMNKANRFPELYLTGLYYSRYLRGAIHPLDDPLNPTLDYPYIDQIKDNRYAQLTIGLSIPLFTRFQTQTNISKSKILLKDYNLFLEQKKQSLYKTIQQNHADALAALDKYISAMEAVTSNEEAFNYTQQKFEVGLVNSVDFNVAKNNLSKARSDLAQAKYEYIFKVKILDFYTGKPIQL